MLRDRKTNEAKKLKHDDPFGRWADFEEAFPGLEDAIIEYRAARPSGAFQTDRPRPTTRISLRTRVPIMHCLNHQCSNGGYDVTAIVREMLAQRETQREGRVECGGREAEPGRAWEQCRKCGWAWDFLITLVLRE